MKSTDFNDKLKIAMNMPIVKKSEPYISVNKLAEYTICTSPVRRRQIIKNLKADSDFFKLYYSEVRNILSKYFNSEYDNSILDKAIAKLNIKKATTQWEINDIANSIIALNLLKESELPDLSDYELTTVQDKIDSVILEGVKVLIKPDIYLVNKYSKKVGGIKFHFSKTESNQLDLTAMQYVATMIKYGYLDAGHTEKEVDNNGCFSIDVFSKNFGTSPTAYKRILGNLEASCQEIAARWDSL